MTRDASLTGGRGDIFLDDGTVMAWDDNQDHIAPLGALIRGGFTSGLNTPIGVDREQEASA